jgi:5'(3')-deoxyribonucleotidase
VPLSSNFVAALESAKKYLDNKEEISGNTLAQLIKGKLIHIKEVEKEKEIFRAVNIKN